MKNLLIFLAQVITLTVTLGFAATALRGNPNLQLQDKVIDYKFTEVALGGGNNIYANVEATCSPNGLAFGKAIIYIKYNSNCLGSSIFTNNLIDVQKGDDAGSSMYTIQVADSTTDILKITILSDFSTLNPNLILGTSSKKLLKLKFKVTDWSQLANINFNDFSMSNNSWYYEDRDYKPFDRVTTNGPITTAIGDEPVGLTFEFDSVSYSKDANNFHYVDFNVNVKASLNGTFLDATLIYFTWNDYVFGTVPDFTFSNGSFFPTPDYDTGANALTFGNDNMIQVYYSADAILPSMSQVPTTPVKMFHVQMKVNNCDSTTNFAFYKDFISASYFGTPLPIQYSPIISNDTYDQAACNDGKKPIIKSVMPLVVAAGIFDTITITGENFGFTKRNVGFQNVNEPDLELYNNAHPEDILSWSDTAIICLVPSVTISGSNKVSPASTGKVLVENSFDSATSDDTLFVKYAILNGRNPVDNLAHRYSLVDYNDLGGYDWAIDFAFDSMGLTDCIREAFCQWNQATGVNWRLPDTTTEIILPTQNGISEIVYANTNSSSILGYMQPHPLECSTNGNIYAETDIVISSNHTFDLFCSTPIGVEHSFKSTILHELGHAHTIDHAKPSPLLMHPYIGTYYNLVVTIGGYDLEAGLDAINFSLANVPCFDTMEVMPLCETNKINENERIIQEFIVFPNPVTADEFHIFLNSVQGIESITVFNLLGQNIAFESIKLSETEFRIKIPHLNKGVYFITARSGSNSMTKKLLKQ